MIAKKLEEALNQQIEMEAYAYFKYLSMASWCEQKSLKGCSKFFYKHADEERQHMIKIFTYLNDVGGHAVAPAVKEPGKNYKDILDIVKTALAGEKEVTKSVHKLSELSSHEKDYATYNFVQFYVNEQQEEEVLFTDLIDKIELIGQEGMGLYYIDKEFEALAGGGGEKKKEKDRERS